MKSQRINLIPDNQNQSLKSSIPMLVALFLMPPILYLAYATLAEYREWKKSESDLKVTNQRLNEIKREIASSISDAAAIGKNRQFRLLESLVFRSLSRAEILKELSLVTPDGAWLETVSLRRKQEPTTPSASRNTAAVQPPTLIATSISADQEKPLEDKSPNELVITGEALDQSTISKFFMSLESSYYFRNVTLNSAERSDESRDVFRFEFTVKLDPTHGSSARSHQ